MTTLVVLWHCLLGENFVRGDIFVYKCQVKNFQSMHKVTKTGRMLEASRATRPLLFVGLQLVAYVYFCVLLSSHNTNVFILYSRHDPYVVWSVHRAFGRLWSRTGHCSWTFYMLMKWSPHFGKTFVIIILVTNFSKNLRDHYIGNEFLEKFSWSLYW